MISSDTPSGIPARTEHEIVPNRMKKWLQRIAIAAIILSLVIWIAGAWLLQRWTAKPPAMPHDTQITSLQPESRDGKIWLGKSWMGHRSGLLVVHLQGTPFE